MGAGVILHVLLCKDWVKPKICALKHDFRLFFRFKVLTYMPKTAIDCDEIK